MSLKIEQSGAIDTPMKREHPLFELIEFIYEKVTYESMNVSLPSQKLTPQDLAKRQTFLRRSVEKYEPTYDRRVAVTKRKGGGGRCIICIAPSLRISHNRAISKPNFGAIGRVHRHG